MTLIRDFSKLKKHLDNIEPNVYVKALYINDNVNTLYAGGMTSIYNTHQDTLAIDGPEERYDISYYNIVEFYDTESGFYYKGTQGRMNVKKDTSELEVIF